MRPTLRHRTLYSAAALALFLGALAFPPGRAAAGEGEISRRVLALYTARETEHGEPAFTDTHEFLEMPLNHLGFVVDYHDVDKPLPDFSPYRGVIVWLDDYEMAAPEAFLSWLLEASRAGVKLILPAGLDAPSRPGGPTVGHAELAEILRRFGLEPASYVLPDALPKLRLNTLRPEYFSFETDMARESGPDGIFRARDDSVEVWQRLEAADDPDIHAVTMAAGEAGFWCMRPDWLHYRVNVPGAIYRVAWNVNPFAMLEAALDSAALPKPDVTTFWGTRGAYSHVDVDGPSNMRQPDVPGPPRTALQVMFEEVWQKYPYPVTLGWIAAEYNPDIDLRFVMPSETPAETLARDRLDWEKPQREIATELRRLAAEISKLPTIQSGCHAYSHPLDWRNLVPGYAIRDYRPTYESEIRGAVEYLNKHVLPPDKPVELYQWSGDCDPPAEALDILADMGMANINGGDPLYDALHNSVYFICALSEPKGRHLQIHSSGSNENIYTDGWNGFKGAYNNVVATFERSNRPLRLLPVNLYYHAFPAERRAGYLAIRHAYDWAAGQDLCWMTALEYVKAAESFFRARIGATGDGGWWVENYGSCPTVRFDRESRAVDMRASRNVAGYSRHNGSLYVALIPGERAEIRLASGRPAAPCLAGSSGMLRGIEAGDGAWRAEIRVWGPGFIELWAPEGEWKATADYGNGKKVEGGADRLPDGRVRFAFPDAAGQWVGVRFEN